MTDKKVSGFDFLQAKMPSPMLSVFDRGIKHLEVSVVSVSCSTMLKESSMLSSSIADVTSGEKSFEAIILSVEQNKDCMFKDNQSN